MAEYGNYGDYGHKTSSSRASWYTDVNVHQPKKKISTQQALAQNSIHVAARGAATQY